MKIAFPLNFFTYIVVTILVIVAIITIALVELSSSGSVDVNTNGSIYTIFSIPFFIVAFRSMKNGNKIGYYIQWCILLLTFVSSVIDMTQGDLNLEFFLVLFLIGELYSKKDNVKS